jgi:hypothetical protein
MDPYALAADGSAKDPRAFQEALRQDVEKMAQLEKVWTITSPCSSVALPGCCEIYAACLGAVTDQQHMTNMILADE